MKNIIKKKIKLKILVNHFEIFCGVILKRLNKIKNFTQKIYLNKKLKTKKNYQRRRSGPKFIENYTKIT